MPPQRPTTQHDPSDREILLEVRLMLAQHIQRDEEQQATTNARLEGISGKVGDLSRWAYGSGSQVGLTTSAALFGARLETAEKHITEIHGDRKRLVWAFLTSIVTASVALIIGACKR